jgi:putative ABC transport system permease protein
MQVFPHDWLVLFVLALLAAMLAAALPALKLARMPAGTFLGVFAHER